MLSEQLCREYGKNTVHKKMLQVSRGRVLRRSGSLGQGLGLQVLLQSSGWSRLLHLLRKRGLHGGQRAKLSEHGACRAHSQRRREEIHLLPAFALFCSRRLYPCWLPCQGEGHPLSPLSWWPGVVPCCREEKGHFFSGGQYLSPWRWQEVPRLWTRWWSWVPAAMPGLTTPSPLPNRTPLAC